MAEFQINSPTVLILQLYDFHNLFQLLNPGVKYISISLCLLYHY